MYNTMAATAILIYPVSIFEHSDIAAQHDVYLIEDPTYFTKFKFHKMKLMLHRASMMFYADYLRAKGHKVHYVELAQTDAFYRTTLKKYGAVILHDVVDHPLTKFIHTTCADHRITVDIRDTLLFIETREDLREYNKTVKNSHYVHDASFYRWQRRRLGILVDGGGEPLYGKWSFDKENRAPFDDAYVPPRDEKINTNKYVIEARKYVEAHFAAHFGDTRDFIYPVTFAEAKALLASFIRAKLSTFGKYEDAVSEDIRSGSHSLLSSSLNIGIITPRFVLDEVMRHFNGLSAAAKRREINNIEAFVRQLIGWRSFTRCMYMFHGAKMMTMNKLAHTYKINAKWYDGTTQIAPIDALITKVRQCAYLHHIERLMYVGNFALLTQVDPRAIYEWFMIVSIDSYEWVMVSNVMGMSQFALTDISMMTRPYFSGSNYLKKMSDFECGEWCAIWDSLYYNFIKTNHALIRANYSTAAAAGYWTKMAPAKKAEHLARAAKYLRYLHDQ